VAAVVGSGGNTTLLFVTLVTFAGAGEDGPPSGVGAGAVAGTAGFVSGVVRPGGAGTGLV